MNETEFASYGDDNTPYTSSHIIDDKIRTFDNYSVRLFKWFSNNHMKVNKDKCHLLLSNKEKVTMKIKKTEITSNNCKNLRKNKVDQKLTFNKHVS